MTDSQDYNKLTPEEQSTTTAYKLIVSQNKSLKESLRKTQDKLEDYREKYHEADKKHAVQLSKNTTITLYEVLKFIISILTGGLGVYFLTEKDYLLGFGILILGIIVYTIVIFGKNIIKKL